MASSIDNRFLGRRLNPQTMCYEHDDGSGNPVPIETRQRIEEMLEGRRQGAAWEVLDALEAIRQPSS